MSPVPPVEPAPEMPVAFIVMTSPVKPPRLTSPAPEFLNVLVSLATIDPPTITPNATTDVAP